MLSPSALSIPRKSGPDSGLGKQTPPPRLSFSGDVAQNSPLNSQSGRLVLLQHLPSPPICSSCASRSLTASSCVLFPPRCLRHLPLPLPLLLLCSPSAKFSMPATGQSQHKLLCAPKTSVSCQEAKHESGKNDTEQQAPKRILSQIGKQATTLFH